MFARALAALALASALAAGACRAAPEPAPQPERHAEKPALGLMTTLPLLWGEAADVGELLAADGSASWVRGEIERRYAIEPLDTLDSAALDRIDRLVLAQPRALSPAENVALDGWVRGGGRLLLFADPMLTRPSRYPVGDRRRPQDVVLLSPILSHWGLELMFDDDAPEGERMVEIAGVGVPINLAGRFGLAPGSQCDLEVGGTLARCTIGVGEVVLLADAAVLDDPRAGQIAPRRAALSGLISLAFD